MKKTLILFTLFMASAALVYKKRHLLLDYYFIEFRHYDIEQFACSDNDLLPINDSRRFIAYAGGGINHDQYTNSQEAVNKSITNGFQLIELDLEVTADKIIVATHDWNHWRSTTKSAITNRVPTHSEFMNHKILNSYTPIDSTWISKLLASNPKIIIVTDKINNFELLVRQIPFPDQLIVEVFNIRDYTRALSAGIKYPALSIGSVQIDNAIKFIRNNKVPLVVLPTAGIKRWHAELLELKTLGVCVFTFSSNERSFLESTLGNTVFGAYTDYWDFNKMSCLHNCKTY